MGDKCSIMRSTESSGGDKCRIMRPRAPRAYGDTVGDRGERRGRKSMGSRGPRAHWKTAGHKLWETGKITRPKHATVSKE